MKKIITVALMLIGFSAFSQITIEPTYKWVTDTAFWFKIKDIPAVSGNNEVNDTVEYIYSNVPEMFNDVRINQDYKYINDSTRFINTKRRRLIVKRSRNGEIQVYVRKEIYTKVHPSRDELMTLYLLKAKELGVKNNNTFWNYPPIDSIVHPEKYITVSDTTITP